MGIMEPENPLVGGTVLRRAAIRSPNFVTGVSGWTINQDGSAEFNNVVIRNGQVVSGTALFYSGPPALGNLVASISAAAGVDSFGNAYKAGVNTYGAGGSYINLLNNTVSIGASSGDTHPGTVQGGAGDLVMKSGGISGVDVAAGITLLSKLLSVSGNNPQVCVGPGTPSPVTGAILEVQGVLSLQNNSAPPSAAGFTELYSASGQPAYVNAAGLQMGLSGAQLADFTQFTVTGTALADITKAWSIPASAPVGSIWELTVSGNGSTPAANTTLQFGGLVGATAGSAGTFGANTFFSAVNPFRFKVTYTIMITATGAAGTFDNELDPVVAIAGNWIPGNSANFIAAGTASNTGGLAIDTTAPSVFKIQAAWGAVVAGGLTARRSTFKRIA